MNDKTEQALGGCDDALSRRADMPRTTLDAGNGGPVFELVLEGRSSAFPVGSAPDVPALGMIFAKHEGPLVPFTTVGASSRGGASRRRITSHGASLRGSKAMLISAALLGGMALPVGSSAQSFAAPATPVAGESFAGEISSSGVTSASGVDLSSVNLGAPTAASGGLALDERPSMPAWSCAMQTSMPDVIGPYVTAYFDFQNANAGASKRRPSELSVTHPSTWSATARKYEEQAQNWARDASEYWGCFQNWRDEAFASFTAVANHITQMSAFFERSEHEKVALLRLPLAGMDKSWRYECSLGQWSMEGVLSGASGVAGDEEARAIKQFNDCSKAYYERFVKLESDIRSTVISVSNEMAARLVQTYATGEVVPSAASARSPKTPKSTRSAASKSAATQAPASNGSPKKPTPSGAPSQPGNASTGSPQRQPGGNSGQ